jgi:hypothetical protein
MSFETLIFNNVELLGYTHQNNFFGENSLNYSATKTISLQGFVLDLENYNGVEKIFNDVIQITKLSQDFYNIVINNQNYGIGKITSLNFDSGNWVRTTRFNAEIQILAEVPLQDLGIDFEGINLSNKKINLLKSFSENFSLNFDSQNKILGGDHSIDIEYDADNKNINLINLAQSLASELLKTIPTDLAEGNYNIRNNYKVLHTEDYDIVNGKCGFKRSFSYGTENTDQPYSLKLNHSIEINQEGICTVKESCEIKAEYDVPTLYDNALKGLKNQLEFSNPYSDRVNPFFQTYKQKFNVEEDLNPTFTEKSVQINKFNGVINYTLNWDNDQKKKNPLYSWEYVQTLDRDQDGIWSVSEDGNINGVGKYGSIVNTKYLNAELGWTNAKIEINTRLLNFYNSVAKNKISNATLKLSSKNISRSPYKGSISYNYQKTDDPRILENDPNYIKRLNITKSDTGLLPIVKNFIIPGGSRRYTLIQNAGLIQQGEYSVKVDMSIGCLPNEQQFNGKNYFNLIRNNKNIYNINFASATPGAKASYVDSISFSSDEIEKNVSFEIAYKYS